MVNEEKLFQILKKSFGFDDFRLDQQAIIETTLSGTDCLAIMPTGGGKSICYQIPSICRNGVGIVVSPLIALMKDQVDGLNANGIEADFYNSSQETEEQTEIFKRADEHLGRRIPTQKPTAV